MNSLTKQRVVGPFDEVRTTTDRAFELSVQRSSPVSRTHTDETVLRERRVLTVIVVSICTDVVTEGGFVFPVDVVHGVLLGEKLPPVPPQNPPKAGRRVEELFGNTKRTLLLTLCIGSWRFSQRSYPVPTFLLH